MENEIKQEPLEEIKGATYEPIDEIPSNENWIQTQIRKLQEKLSDMRKQDKEKEFLSSEEGKRWKAQHAELLKMQERERQRNEDIFLARLYEAKVLLTLRRLAQKELKKNDIKDDDPALASVLRELEEVSLLKQNAYLTR